MIYLDNAATTFPKPARVIDSVCSTMKKICANPGRGGHDLSIICGNLVYRTREKIAGLINADDCERIIFTSNCTEALNMAIKGAMRPGMHVVTTQLEHNSVLRVLKTLERRGFIRVTVVAPGADGIIEAKNLAAACNRRTRMMVVSHVSNVLGTIQPIAEIGEFCRANGIFLVVDAAQSAGVVPIDVKRMGIDMLAAPGHKSLYGPQGTGFLYVSSDLDLDTIKEGGTGTASESVYQPFELPERFESGTLNTPGIAGLFAGLCFIKKNSAEIRNTEGNIKSYMMSALPDIPGLRLYGSKESSKKVAVFAFNIGNIQSGIVADELNRRGIAVRAGLHCAPLAHAFLGTAEQGAVRASFGAFNTIFEAKALLTALREISRDYMS